jgi:hypothetical protein
MATTTPTTQTRHERLEGELAESLAELAEAEKHVEEEMAALERARADRNTLIREVGDLRAALGLKRDGEEKSPRAPRAKTTAAEASGQATLLEDVAPDGGE